MMLTREDLLKIPDSTANVKDKEEMTELEMELRSGTKKKSKPKAAAKKPKPPPKKKPVPKPKRVFRFKAGDRFTTPEGFDKTDPPWPEASGKVIKAPKQRTRAGKPSIYEYEVRFEEEDFNRFLGAIALDQEAL